MCISILHFNQTVKISRPMNAKALREVASYFQVILRICILHWWTMNLNSVNRTCHYCLWGCARSALPGSCQQIKVHADLPLIDPHRLLASNNPPPVAANVPNPHSPDVTSYEGENIHTFFLHWCQGAGTLFKPWRVVLNKLLLFRIGEQDSNTLNILFIIYLMLVLLSGYEP